MNFKINPVLQESLNSSLRKRELQRFHKQKLQAQKDHLKNLIAKKARLDFEIKDLTLNLKRNLYRSSKDLNPRYLTETNCSAVVRMESFLENQELYETILETSHFLEEQNSLTQKEREDLENSIRK